LGNWDSAGTTTPSASREVSVFHKANNLPSRRSLRWVLIGIGSLVIVALSGYLLLRVVDYSVINPLNEAKKGRTTTAVVKAKEHVRFDGKNHSYIGDFGEPMNATPHRAVPNLLSDR
jgi:hypothetical protein